MALPTVTSLVIPVGAQSATLVEFAPSPITQSLAFVSVMAGKLNEVLPLAPLEANPPIPVVLQFAVAPTLVPEYEIPTTMPAFVQVPDPVSEDELETLQPTRNEVVLRLCVVTFVQPLGSVGGVLLTARYARMIFRSPVFVPLNVQDVDWAPQVPSLLVAASNGIEQANRENASTTPRIVIDLIDRLK